jgi:glucosylceramidase
VARRGGVLATAGEQEVVWEELGTTHDSADTEVAVDLEDRRHRIEGFGPALTHSAAWLLLQRPRAERHSLLTELFSPRGAIRLNTLRIPLGTCDFAPEEPTPRYHSLADERSSDDDPLGNLSLERDEKTILPVLREILAIAGKLTVILSPWSAPAWMKTSGDLVGGELIDDEGTRELYAEYLVRSVAAYEKAVPGLRVTFLTVQNEPLHDEAVYPCMGMDTVVQTDVIRLVHEKLSRRHLRTRVLSYDHNWDRVDYPVEVLEGLADEGITDVGSAFHAYAGTADAVDPLHEAFPDVPIWFTEQSGTQDPDKPFEKDFADGIWWMSNQLFLPALTHHHRGVVLFNLVLDQDGGPGPATFTNGTGLVQMDTATGQLTLNSELYVLAHHSRFLPPGSRVVGSPSTEDLPTLAVRRKDGRVVVVLHNNHAAREVTVRVGKRRLTASLPGWTLATYVLTGC